MYVYVFKVPRLVYFIYGVVRLQELHVHLVTAAKCSMKSLLLGLYFVAPFPSKVSSYLASFLPRWLHTLLRSELYLARPSLSKVAT